MGVHRFFDERDFYYVHTPIITGSDCEGAGEMFRVSHARRAQPPRPTRTGGADYAQDFFGRETNLTVSGQLNVETYCQALSRVYTFGPTFRAENSNTSRHLAEFWMIEPEIAFADLADNATLAEDMLKYLFDDVLTRRADDMAFFDLRIEKGLIDKLKGVIDSSFRTLPYTEAIDILKKAKKKFEYPVEWGLDMQSEHERYLTEEHFKQPLVVINYPKEIKAFYMRLNDAGTDGAPGGHVAAMDVLAPGIGEIIGGSQREERLDVLDRASTRWASTRTTTGGTATSASTAPSPTPASGWASSASSSSARAWATSATSSRSRAESGSRAFPSPAPTRTRRWRSTPGSSAS
jgi:asparaginyl-tRNA synthetase